MAALGTKGGSVTLPSGFSMDVQEVTINETQPTEDVTAFGNTTDYSASIASGTLTQVITCTGFANSTASGLGATTVTGATATFTFDTSRAVTGNYIVRNRTLTTNRTRAAVGMTLELVNSGDVGTHTL